MMWLFAILVVLVLGIVAAVASGRGVPLAEEYDDRPVSLVPRTERLSGADIRRVRFPLAIRGYRMEEVDALLDRLAAEREAEEPAVERREDVEVPEGVDDAEVDPRPADGTFPPP